MYIHTARIPYWGCMGDTTYVSRWFEWSTFPFVKSTM